MAEANWDDVTAARTHAEGLQRSAVEYSSRGNTLADELRKAIGERFGESPVAKQSAEARAGFLGAAPQARADISGLIQGGAILSPTQQQQIMAAKRGAALVPVMGTNLIQEATFGTLQDLIGAGVNAYNAQAQNIQGLAGIAQGSYQNILNELLQRAQLAAQQEQLGMQKAAAGREAELFPIQKQTAEAQLYKLLHPSTGLSYAQGLAATEKSKANEIKQWLSTQTNSRSEAEQDKRALLAKGYDLNTIDNVIDSLYPKPEKPGATSQWEAQQYVSQQAAIIESQQGIDAAKAYIKGQGFDPMELGYY